MRFATSNLPTLSSARPSAARPVSPVCAAKQCLPRSLPMRRIVDSRFVPGLRTSSRSRQTARRVTRRSHARDAMRPSSVQCSVQSGGPHGGTAWRNVAQPRRSAPQSVRVARRPRGRGRCESRRVVAPGGFARPPDGTTRRRSSTLYWPARDRARLRGAMCVGSVVQCPPPCHTLPGSTVAE